ncbi:MAG: crotonase/enoyl-CoA hydratase family protein [Dehalococcoidia bacterium]
MPVHYERTGAAAVLTIDRPDRRNAVDGPTAESLREGFRRFVEDDSARVLVVTGAGGHAFCAGADLKAMSNPVMAPEGPMGFTRLVSPKPTIAAVEGWCVAGGLEIACWCDFRVVAEGARFGCLERRWGVPLIDGGTQRLPRIIGTGRALDLILTARQVDAQEALSMGLANYVVPKGQALTAALELAGKIAAYPWACVIADRRALYEGLDRPLETGLEIEAMLGRGVITDAQQGAMRFAGGEGRHGRGA